MAEVKDKPAQTYPGNTIAVFTGYFLWILFWILDISLPVFKSFLAVLPG